MSELEHLLVVDTRTINTLLYVDGTAGLDTLFASGDRVVILKDMIDEVRLGPASFRQKIRYMVSGEFR